MDKTTFLAHQNTLTVKRNFNAPLDLVWRAWTESQLLDQWWAPKPWKSETKYMSFKVGGYRLYAMVSPEGEKHWGKTDYDFILPEKEFSGKDSFCDEDGNINTAAPISHFTIHFSEVSDHTEVIINSEYDSVDDLTKVIEMGMKEGLSGSFCNLDEVLRKLPIHDGNS